jgi:hypothetical protein
MDLKGHFNRAAGRQSICSRGGKYHCTALLATAGERLGRPFPGSVLYAGQRKEERPSAKCLQITGQMENTVQRVFPVYVPVFLYKLTRFVYFDI